MIRVDAAWLATAPLDMRAGADSALARVIAVFGAVHPHHACLFANRRGNRIKILVYDGQGIWLAARRLHQGKFRWPRANTPNANLMVSSSKPEPPPTLSQRAVSVMSLIQSAKLNGHDPHLYLKDVMDKPPTWPNRRMDELLPHRWQPANNATSSVA